MGKIRYTVDFPEVVMNTLSRVSIEKSISKADALRQAIALFAYVTNEVSKGEKRNLSITEGDRVVKDIILLNQ